MKFIKNKYDVRYALYIYDKNGHYVDSEYPQSMKEAKQRINVIFETNRYKKAYYIEIHKRNIRGIRKMVGSKIYKSIKRIK